MLEINLLEAWEKQTKDLIRGAKNGLLNLGYFVVSETPSSLGMAKTSEDYSLRGIVGFLRKDRGTLLMGGCIVDEQDKVVECRNFLGGDRDTIEVLWEYENPDYWNFLGLAYADMEMFLSKAARPASIKPVRDVCDRYKKQNWEKRLRRNLTRQSNNLPG